MCNFANNIKFCRCETKTSSAKPIWTLKRYSGVDWMMIEQGRCHIPYYDDNAKNTIENIVSVLNILQADCFDMDYQAFEGDTLNIEMPNKKTCYEFEFKNGAWQHQHSISAHLNRDLVIASGWVEE